MKINVGGIDRILRILVGVVLVALAATGLVEAAFFVTLFDVDPQVAVVVAVVHLGVGEPDFG